MSDSIHKRHANCVRILREWRTIWARRPKDDPKDSAVWVYASGFPKSLDVSAAIDDSVRAEWLGVGKAIDSLDAGIILSAWIERCDGVRCAGLRFARNETETGTSTPASGSVHAAAARRRSRKNRPLPAPTASGSSSEAHLTSEESSTALDAVAATMAASSAPANTAGGQPESLAATSTTGSSALPDAWGSLDESTLASLKGAEALKTLLGSEKSSRLAATDALCAALADDWKLITESRSRTTQSCGTTSATDSASATDATITESTAASLISFTAATLKRRAIDKAAGAERVATGIEPRRPNPRAMNPGGAGQRECDASTRYDEPATPEGERWAGYGTALKPAREPVILARKPLDGTVAQNALTHGVGGINVDGCRIVAEARYVTDKEPGGASNVYASGISGTAHRKLETTTGRWPANLVLTHDERCVRVGTRKVATGTAHRTNGGGNTFGGDVEKPAMADMSYAGADGKEEIEAWECAPGCPVAELDRQSGDRPGMSGGGAHADGYGGGMFGGIDCTHTARGDDGGASRFFYCVKASSTERTFGAPEIPICPKCRRTSTPKPGNFCPGPDCVDVEMRPVAHPTVKPIKLAKYLATLILPPARASGAPRRLLVPYSGSGSEMIGAMRAGWDEIVGIQRTSDDEEKAYVAIAKARLERWAEVRADMDEAEACGEERKRKSRAEIEALHAMQQAGLFDMIVNAYEGK